MDNSPAMNLELFLVDYEERKKQNNFDFEAVNNEIKSLASPIREIPEYILENETMLENIVESAETLREITSSTGMEFYLVDPETNEVYKCPQTPNESIKTDIYKVGPGTIMAAYVAEKKMPIVSNDVARHKEFPMGVSRQGFTAKCGMCLPLITLENNVIGIIQLTKDDGSRFTLDHLEIGMNMCSWISSAIEQFYQKEDIAKENELYTYFIYLMNMSTSDNASYLALLPEMMSLTSYRLNAETCNYYTYSSFAALEDLGEKVIMFSPGNNDKYSRRVELDLTSRTIANEVITGDTLINIGEEMISTNYITVIYSPRVATSVMAAPLRVCGMVRGALEMVNKVDNSTFTERDILILRNITSFCEYLLSQHILDKQINNLYSFMAYRHNTMIHHMKPCVHNLELMKSLAKARTSHSYKDRTLDLPMICSDIDNMFHSVVKRWKRFDEVKRHSFLLMVMKATLVSPLIDMRKVWSSLQFVTTVLRTYSTHFTETEKEVMMFSCLCYDVNNPPMPMEDIEDSRFIKPFPDLDTDLKSGFIPCDSFYLIRTLFTRSNLFTLQEVKRLMEQISIYIPICHMLRIHGAKEKLLKLLINRQLRLKNAKHRYLMRVCVMAVAGQALYLKPAIFTADILLNIVIAARGCDMKCGSAFEYDLFPHISTKDELAKVVLMNLKINILPWVILLRTILPRLKLYLRRCIEAIDDWKKLKIKHLKHYWFPETSEPNNDAARAVVTYLEDVGGTITSSVIRKAKVYKIKRRRGGKNKGGLGRWNKLPKLFLRTKRMRGRPFIHELNKFERKKWKKTVKRLKFAQKEVHAKLSKYLPVRLKNAYLKRIKIINALEDKRKAKPSRSAIVDDQQKAIIISKNVKNKLVSKVLEAFGRNPDKIKANLKKLLEAKRKRALLQQRK